MSLTYSKMLDLGTILPDFKLINTAANNEIFSSDDLSSNKGKVIMFICNHCPYVIHYHDQILEISKKYKDNIDFVAISSNDSLQYPEDGPVNMRRLSIKLGFDFPYLYDESQDIARIYNAQCTPEFYLFDKNNKLIYRGRMDNSSPYNGKKASGLDLRVAVDNFILEKEISMNQFPSMGCSIKWK